jgi:hypothetical protein
VSASGSLIRLGRDAGLEAAWDRTRIIIRAAAGPRLRADSASERREAVTGVAES